MLIGLVAKAQHGKSSVAKHLIDKYEFERKSFADPLKQMLIKAGLCTYEECYVEKTKQSRMLMQKIGTEVFREQVDSDYWINKFKLDSDFDQYSNKFTKDVVIDDLRFKNEARFIKDCGGTLIRIERINKDGSLYLPPNTDLSHKSESELDSIICDFTLRAKSGGLKQLFSDIDFIIKKRYNNG